jgi:hypothetical protein
MRLHVDGDSREELRYEIHKLADLESHKDRLSELDMIRIEQS